MISLKQISKTLISISLVLFISITTALGFMGENSFASTLQISSLSNQIAWGDENKETDDKNLEGKTEVQMEESQKFDRETQDGISNAIQNPDYKPDGKTKQVEKDDRQATKNIKAEASDAMLSNRLNRK